MYQLGQRTIRRRKARAISIFVLLVILVVAGFAVARMLRPQTVVQQSVPSRSHIDVAVSPKITVKGNVFQMEVPENWKPTTVNSIYTSFSWKGTSVDDSARQVDVYVDNLPTDLAVNRLLPVRAEGGSIIPTGDVSDNCINFTDKSAVPVQPGVVMAKWAGITFLCDTGNYLRNVIGTGSADGINNIEVTGDTTGRHHFFFVYTDHSAEPDYSKFTDMLKSFAVR